GEAGAAPRRDLELSRRISLATGRAITFTLAQLQTRPRHWVEILERTERANAEGARLVPQVAGRPSGLLASFETFNPFRDRPGYAALAALPLSERLRRLREPATRAPILAEREHHRGSMALMPNSLDPTFALERGPVFPP